jgi:ribonuclease III
MSFNHSTLKLQKTEEKSLKIFIKNTLGFSPKNFLLYKQAFIHKSLSSENSEKNDNERLEFLGDSVLNIIIAEYLYKKYPLVEEGFLTELRARILNGNHLNKLSRKMGLDLFIKTNDCDLMICESLIGNAFEAFIGALYLDKGFEFTKKVFITKILNTHIDIDLLAKVNSNYKGKILIWSQKVKNKIEYKIVKEILYNKRKQYIVHLFVDEQFISEGCDYCIKGAEQCAAMLACEILDL